MLNRLTIKLKLILSDESYDTMTTSDTLVRDFFPEDTQRHALFYEDPNIQTLNQGIRFLYRVSNHMLRYRQQISLQNLFQDRSYEGLIHHRPEHGILTIRFPSECIGIGHIRNNRGCRMVTYSRHSGTVREITVTPRTTMDLLRNREMELIIYTTFDKTLVISFDVYLQKVSSPRSAL